MYALVENGQITKTFTYPKGFTLNGNQYPAKIFEIWTSTTFAATEAMVSPIATEVCV